MQIVALSDAMSCVKSHSADKSSALDRAGYHAGRGVRDGLYALSPNCNPHAERFVRSARSECLDHGTWHLRYLLREFAEHYHTEHYHQGLAGRLIRSRTAPSNDNCSRGDIASRSRLGGLLNFYLRQAA
jgi:hypothetical protein